MFCSWLHCAEHPAYSRYNSANFHSQLGMSLGRACHQNINVTVLAMISSEGPCGRCTAPPATEVGRRMERKRQKLLGWDKGSLTELQTKANSNNNNTDKQNIQKKQ